MKKVLIMLFVTFVSFANALNIGESLPTFSIKNQFEKAHTLKNDTQTIIVASGKSTSEIIRDYLLKQEGDFLTKNKAVYVADISGMPSLIAKFFALPKMKKYPFSVLLVDEEQTKKFSKQDDKITIYRVNEGKITSVNYITNEAELAKVFN